MCVKGKRHATLLERETQTQFRYPAQNNLNVHMLRTLFSLTISPFSSSCEAGGGGGRLAPPAPERGGCTWEAAVISMTVHKSEKKNRKQDDDKG